MTRRSAGYGVEEDVLLCQVYMDILQNPIVGKYQSSSDFWNRVSKTYNNVKQMDWQFRNVRSAESRMKKMLKAVKKLNATIQQVERTIPSCASDQDIVNHGKMLLVQTDPIFKRGFKFNHAWNALKDINFFSNNVTLSSRNSISSTIPNNVSSKSDTTIHDSQIPEFSNSSSFSLNLDDDSGESMSKQPMGARRVKMKKKRELQQFMMNEKILAKPDKFYNLLETNSFSRNGKEQVDMQSQIIALEREKIALFREVEEDKILMMDLNAITNPKVRACLEAKQQNIVEKRARQE